MLATQPVVDASRPSFEVGEDLVDPRQDEVSGGLPDDMDIVAIGGDRSVAGPAVGFRDGVGIGGGFDEVSEVGGAVGGDRPAAGGRDVSVPEFDGADDEHLAVVAAYLALRWEDRLWPEWKAGLVDFHQARQRVARSTMLARSLWASSQALRYEPIPSCFWSCRAEMPLQWVAIR